MSVFDLILIIILLGFTLNGLLKGIIRIVGHFIALIFSSYLASHYYILLFNWLKPYIHGNESVIKVLIFIVTFILSIKIITLGFILLEKLFNLVAIIPFSKYINNLLGALLGFLEGSLILGLILYVISKYSIVGTFFGDQLSNSQVVPILLKITSIIYPLLPSALKSLQSLIQ